MTKHEELVWRLKEQPTTESLRELVKDKLLTNEEARQILFKTVEEVKGRDKESLETEIKFLRELVEKLSKDRTQIVEIIKKVEVPYYHYNWYTPYTVWCGTGLTNLSNGSINATYTGGLATQCTSNSSLLGQAQNCSFSAINTF